MTTKNYFLHTMMPVMLYGAFTGIVTGAVIWGYQFLVEKLLSVSQSLYSFVNQNLAFLPLLIAGLVVAASLSYLNTQLVPEVKGGGVPYAEGAARGILPLKWYRVVPAAIFGSFLSFVCGLPLGSEGPSVLIGSALGSGVNDVGSKNNKRRKSWSTISITAGASAGFAAALGAPLAGVLLALEECHKKFSPIVLMSAAVSVLFALFTGSLLRIATGISEHALFTFAAVNFETLDLHLPLIAGVFAGLCGVGFLKLLTYSIHLMGKIKVSRYVKTVAAFLLSGVACFFFADMIGGGAGVIDAVGNMAIEWKMIFFLLVMRLFLILFCSSSQISGGMFIPFLCLGALLGGLLGNFLVFFGMNEMYYSTIVLVTMCAFLGSLLQAPITAVVLIIELAGGMSPLLGGMIAIMAAYLVTGLFRAKPAYDEMLENILKNRNQGKELKFVKVEIIITRSSHVIGKVLREILLPFSVTSVQHKHSQGTGEAQYKNYRRWERIIREGDVITLQARTADEQVLLNNLTDIFGNATIISE